MTPIKASGSNKQRSKHYRKHHLPLDKNNPQFKDLMKQLDERVEIQVTEKDIKNVIFFLNFQEFLPSGAQKRHDDLLKNGKFFHGNVPATTNTIELDDFIVKTKAKSGVITIRKADENERKAWFQKKGLL